MHVPRVFSPEGSARSTRSSGSCGRRRSRTSGGGRSSSRSTARSPGAGASWRPTSWPASTSTATWPAATAARRRASASIGPPAGRPRDPDDRRLGQGRRLLRHRRGRRAVLRRADGALPEPVRLVQLAGLVQRRAVPPLRDRRPGQQLALGRGDPGRRARPTAPTSIPQASACFIQSVSDDMEGIMRLATSEAMLFKFGSGTGTDLSTLRSSQREALRRRQAVGSGQLHAGLRRDRQRGQVGRQDAPRRQDADPQVLAPRHPRIHRVQDQGREEGPGPDPRRLRGQLQRRSLQLGDVPERQPLGPRAPTRSSAPSRPTATGPPAPSPPAGRWRPTRPGC